jgi:hypothetical protein
MIKPTPAVTLPAEDLLRGTIWATVAFLPVEELLRGHHAEVSWAGNNPLHVATVQGGCHNNLWHRVP